jgi:hypothetical protein
VSELVGEARREVLRALAAWLGEQNDRRPDLAAMLGTEFTSKLLYSRNPQLLANIVLKRAETTGRYEDPPWQYTLVEMLPQSTTMAAILAGLPSAPAPRPPDPLQAHWMAHGRPFLDRDELRTALGQLLEPNGYGALVVNGPTRCGKTYTADVIDWLSGVLPVDEADDIERFSVVRVQIDKTAPAIFDAELVARRILSGMGVDATLTERHAETVRWIHHLCDDVLSRTPQGRRWCWVFDGVCVKDVPNESRLFVTQLVNLVTASSALRERVRLVLIDFDLKLISNEQVPALRPATLGGPGSIGASDVRASLLTFFAQIIDDPGTTVDEITERVVTGLPRGRRRLQEISERLQAETKPFRDAVGL